MLCPLLLTFEDWIEFLKIHAVTEDYDIWHCPRTAPEKYTGWYIKANAGRLALIIEGSGHYDEQFQHQDEDKELFNFGSLREFRKSIYETNAIELPEDFDETHLLRIRNKAKTQEAFHLNRFRRRQSR